MGVEAAETRAVRRARLWLLLIVGAGLALRAWRLDAPLQQDEFGPLYAVAERASARPGWTPTESDPLLPVSGLDEVRARSVLPYGIVNPYPIYHDLLYGIVRVLPIAEWSLRLPSLLAGLGCVAVVYLICRRLLGTGVALVAALLVALDPMQVQVSVLARPYALANLACVLSFLGLLLILHARRPRPRAAAALLYGVSLALQGYLNPVLLLSGVAHLGLLAYWWFGRRYAARAGGAEEVQPNRAPWSFDAAPRRSVGQLAWWLAGCLLALGLLAPELDYVRQVSEFSRGHGRYLLELAPPRLSTILLHNSTFLMGLLVISVAGSLLKRLTDKETAGGPAADAAGRAAGPEPARHILPDAAGAITTKESKFGITAGPVPSFAGEVDEDAREAPPPLPAENPDLLWLGRCWLLLPQLAVVLLAFSTGQQVLLSRYLSYVTFGGMILLAYWATRERWKEVRVGVVTVMALVTFGWGLTPYPGTRGLVSSSETRRMVAMLNERDEAGAMAEDDLILYRAGFLEADFLPDDIPARTRAHVEGVLASPLTTLYVGANPHPLLVLSLSHRRNDRAYTARAGRLYDPSGFYNEDLAEKVRPHRRYWVCTDSWNRQAYVECLLCWLANAQPWDLRVARNRPDEAHYFVVRRGLGPDDYAAGLSDSRPGDFPAVFLVRRAAPGGVFTLGALGASTAPNAHVTVPVWLATQNPTPGPAAPPGADVD